MKIIINTISTKHKSGGAFQIALNFLLATLKYKCDNIVWFYFTSHDVDAVLGDKFKDIYGSRYFVFPTQPDFKKTYINVKKQISILEKTIMPDLIYTISAPSYFSFKAIEVLRFANAWVTNPNKYAWKSLSFKKKLWMKLYCINQKRLLKKAKYIITQSDTVKRGLLKITNLPSSHIGVVENVLPMVFQENKITIYNHDERWIDIISVAAAVPHKNINIVVDILKELNDKYGINNVRFHLTLSENSRVWNDIRIKMQKYNLEQNIINHGPCSQTQLMYIYNECSICFLPTLLETFSASSLEGMFYGLFIVASDFSFNRDVINDAGLYYKPMDVHDACRKIIEIIYDKNLRDILSANMKKQIQKYISYEDHFYKTIGFLKDVFDIENNNN